MNKELFYKIIFLLFFFGGVMVIFSIEKKIKVQLPESVNVVAEYNKEDEEKYAASIDSDRKKIEIVINDNKMIPDVINVNKNDKVSLIVRVEEGYHNLYLDIYHIGTNYIPTNKKEILRFDATMSGQFKFFSHTYRYKKEPEGKLIVR